MVTEERKYNLRVADDTAGERCVSVDDLVDWLLSITDEGEFEDETYRFVQFMVDRLIGLKNIDLCKKQRKKKESSRLKK